MKKILSKEHPTLRLHAREVARHEIQSSAIQGYIQDMQRALRTQEDGVAIAAPQIGISLQIFIISEKIQFGRHPSFRTDEEVKKDPPKDHRVFINPRIIKKSRKKQYVEEGCLSVRWLYGKVSRAQQVTIEAYDEYGKIFREGASGLRAQIFQHEIDHLHGVLFIDHAQELQEIPPDDRAQNTPS